MRLQIKFYDAAVFKAANIKVKKWFAFKNSINLFRSKIEPENSFEKVKKEPSCLYFFFIESVLGKSVIK